jgi:diguanylate cyclase (GGDEF)-like protein/PAS domain S-box-containing protein
MASLGVRSTTERGQSHDRTADAARRLGLTGLRGDDSGPSVRPATDPFVGAPALLVGALTGLVGVYLAFAAVSGAVQPTAVHELSFAAPVGVAAAATVMFPRRLLAAVIATVFAAALLAQAVVLGAPIGWSVTSALATALEAGVFAWLVTAVWPNARRLSNCPDVLRLFAAAGLVTVVGAAFATVPFTWPVSTVEAWALRFASHCLGILAIVPAVLVLPTLLRVNRRGWLEIVAFSIVLIALTEVGFDPAITVAFPYIPLGAMLVMIVRLKTPGAVVLPWTLAPVALLYTNHGDGPFTLLTSSIYGQNIALQLYGLTAVVCAWLIAAVLAERDTATRALEDAHQALEHERGTLEARVDARTAQLAAATRMAELGAMVSESLAEAHLDPSMTMDDIARHVADALHAVCIIGVASDDETEITFRAIYAADPVLQHATAEACSGLRIDVRGKGFSGDAVKTGHAVRAAGRPEELAAHVNPSLRGFCLELGVRALAIAAMHHRDQVVGTVTLLRTADAPFDDVEALLLEDLGARAGLAIANARLHAEVIESEERFQAAFDDGPLGMAIIDLAPDRSGVILKANEALCRLAGYAPDSLVGSRLSTLLPRARHSDEAPLEHALVRTLPPGRAREFPLVRADGWQVWVRYNQSVVWHGNRAQYAVALIEDITAIKHVEGELRRHALHDPLTGLANRQLFGDHLELALEQLKRVSGTVALLYFDLDRFKDVNDSFGHEVGDQVLREVGERLRRSVRTPDTAARLGGDEFVVLCPGLGEDVDATEIAERLGSVLNQPYDVEGRAIAVGASIGITTTHTGDPVDADELLRQADLAMYAAKQAGRHRWSVYDPELGERARKRHDVETYLRRALEEHWLKLHYQPVIDLRSERIVGFEALLRIEHPQRGLVAPDAFIDVAEESDLIIPIGEWVLHETCRQLAEWRHYGDFEAAVNISGRQVATNTVTDAVLAATTATGVVPANLTLEMTERVLIDAGDPTLADLELLTSHGVRLAIDDFGTGYSSLTYLNRFPVDTVKIDRSFIAGLGVRERDTAIVEAITGLARTLDLTAVAEGVETEEQLETLRELGCDRGQGYHLGRPMPAEDVTTLLASQTCD